MNNNTLYTEAYIAYATNTDPAREYELWTNKEAVLLMIELADTLDDMMSAMIEPAPSTFKEWRH